MSESEAETKYCSNCKKDIAAANFTMHEVHCRRHLVLCQHCEEPVPRTELDQHFNDVHAKIACTLCGTEVEKEQLDTHMGSDCSKRNVSCEYCELEMPHDELAQHVEYCGTRTEACARCGTYIMHKDSLQHKSSNCTYPPPTVTAPPTNTNTAPGFVRLGGADGDGRAPVDERAFREMFGYGTGELSTSLDPFTFEEIRRALGPGIGGDFSERNMPSLPMEDSDASAAAGERAMVIDMNKRRTKKTKVPVQKNDTRSRGSGQRGEQRSTRKSTTNKRSDVNRQRETEVAIPPDMDYDTMLAMQLSVEDDEPDPDEHLNQLISSYEKRSRPQVRRNVSREEEVVPASPPHQNEFDAADEDMIPCEFCGETFPAFALVHHQSVCDPLASNIWGTEDDIPAPGRRNNEPSFWRPSDSRPAIPVINNLGSASPAPEPEVGETYHLTDNGDYLLNSLENIMLPCEFCSELLPADILVQHQAVCEVNSSATPRVMTPSAAQPSSGFPPPGPRNRFFPTSPTQSRRRQADPTEALWSAISGRGDEENEPVPVRGLQKKRPNVPKGSSPSSRHVPVLTRHGGADLSSVRSIHPARSSRRPADEGQGSDMLLHARGSKPSSQSRSDNSSRTRHTLNRLLSDEDGTEQVNPGPRRKVPNTGSTGVSSRSVMQALQREQRGSRRSSADQDRSNGTTVDLSDGRQRERGDHVFNGADNSRSQTQTRSRRSSSRQVPEWN